MTRGRLPGPHIVGRSGDAVLAQAEDRRAPAFERFRDATASDGDLFGVAGVQNDLIAVTPRIEELEGNGIQSVFVVLTLFD